MTLKYFGSIVAIALLLLALSLSSTSDLTSAKGKPPKSPTATPTPGGGGCPDLGGGTIYYADANDVVHELDADCGTDSTLPSVPANSWRPSKARHNELRWFLRTEAVTGLPGDPNGRLARELWSYAEDGTSAQLTDYTLGGTTPSDTFIYDGGMQWAPDDGFVSWVGAHWVDDDGDGNLDRMDAAGIYRADLTFDGSGNVSGLTTPRPVLPTVLVDASASGLPVYRHAWSPDASRLAYGRNYQLYRVDTIPNNNPSSHVLLDDGDVPDWSSSDRIAYNTSTSNRTKVLSIQPDGSNSVQLASARNSLVGFPWWSPTGSHAIYLSDPCCPFDIYRVAADGSGKTLLVPNGDALGWVAED